MNYIESLIKYYIYYIKIILNRKISLYTLHVNIKILNNNMKIVKLIVSKKKYIIFLRGNITYKF